MHGGAARLAQVISNLVGNAAKYTPPGGDIRVVARRDGEQVELRVIDNGIGIPAGDAGRVKGTGIGLRNVNERLRVIYGANYQLQPDSVPRQGTCARVVTPEMRMLPPRQIPELTHSDPTAPARRRSSGGPSNPGSPVSRPTRRC